MTNHQFFIYDFDTFTMSRKTAFYALL